VVREYLKSLNYHLKIEQMFGKILVGVIIDGE